MALKALLTEIDSLKGQLEGHFPLAPQLQKDIREDWEITHTYHSNAIEGNTLTLGETKAVLLDGITISGKSLREHLEAVNHREAMRLMTRLSELNSPIKESEILDLHRIILTGIQSEDAGRYRSVRVRVAGSMRIFPNPLKVPELMSEFVEGLSSFEGHPVLKAAKAHYELVAIHPFVDGNGRTARLLMNLLLLRAGYIPALLAVEERGRYYDTLEAANSGYWLPFEMLIAEAVKASLLRMTEVLS